MRYSVYFQQTFVIQLTGRREKTVTVYTSFPKVSDDFESHATINKL